MAMIHLVIFYLVENNTVMSLQIKVRSSRPDVFCEKVFLEISQNSQENTCARASFLISVY